MLMTCYENVFSTIAIYAEALHILSFDGLFPSRSPHSSSVEHV